MVAVVAPKDVTGSAGRPWPPGTLLGRLPQQSAAALLGLGHRVSFGVGRRLLMEGDPGDRAYLLVAGQVKITGNEYGAEPLLAVRVAGDIVGELAVLSGASRSATVSACTPVVARAIPGVQLRLFLTQHPRAAVELAATIGDRLRWANQRRVDFAALNAAGRVGSVLIALAEAYGRPVKSGLDIGAPLTQREIASLAGLRPSSCEKVLRQQREAGVLELRRCRVVIVRMAGLRDLVSAGGEFR